MDDYNRHSEEPNHLIVQNMRVKVTNANTYFRKEKQYHFLKKEKQEIHTLDALVVETDLTKELLLGATDDG